MINEINGIIHPHPEWKRLFEVMKNEATHGRMYTYEQIREVMGVDARTSYGRKQFHRCAKELLICCRLHFENVLNKGYRVVDAHEHVNCAKNQVVKARRRLRKGAAIAIHTELADLSDRQRKDNADVLCKLAALERTTTETLREIRGIAAGKRERLPPVLPQRGEQFGGDPTGESGADQVDSGRQRPCPENEQDESENQQDRVCHENTEGTIRAER